MIDGTTVNHYLIADLQQHPLAQEQLKKLLSLAALHRKPSNDRIDSRSLQTRACKLAFDLFLGPCLLGLQINGAPRTLHQIPGDRELALRYRVFERNAEYLRRQS